MAKKSLVAIIRTHPNSILDDIHTLCHMAQMEEALARENPTILKENISWHFPFPGVNTTPWQLEGAITTLKDSGFEKLVCVGNNTVVTNPKKGERLCRLHRVLDRYGVEILYNFISDHIKWEVYQPKAEMLVLHKIYPRGIKIPSYFKDKNIVHLPTMKTHIYTTTTGAMKNAFGGLLNSRRHYTHSVIHETLVDLLSIQKEIHKGLFAITDGTTCGSGPGPRTVVPVRADLMLASSDMVAIDAVSASLMGFDSMSIPYIRMAHERGLGVGTVDEIEIAGENIRSLDMGFTVGDNLASVVGDLFWFGRLKMLQRALFRTPLVYLFVMGSYGYHDLYWWPLKGKRILEKWRKENPWGKLFDSYSK